MFSKKKNRKKSSATVNETYHQSQLKKVLAAAKITTSVTCLPQIRNSWIFLFF